MSYILDALRRADADRDRGLVPGLHTQPASVRATPTGRRIRWPWVAFGGLAVAVALSIGGWLLGAIPQPERRTAATTASGGAAFSTPPDRIAAATPPAAISSTGPNSAAAALAVPSESGAAPAAVAPAVPATPTIPKAPPSAAIEPPAPGRGVGTPAAVPAQRPPRAAVRASAASAPSAAARQAPAASAPAPPRIYARAELPAEVQRDLPELVVGGATYSENPSSRMLIVNGQIFREGDALAPGVLLRQIRLKSAVLEVKGYRYGIGF